jgi:ABC-2 type transport system ATP-binding protein
MTSVLEFQAVSKSYGKKAPVLHGINLSIQEGEVVGLLGRNGAGKTTLIRLVMGMLCPDSGSIMIFGISPMEDPVAVKKRIGYVSEDQILPERSTIAELIAFHRYLFKDWDRSLESRLINRFCLPLNSTIKALSKGQARQVALLCAICHRPEFLILDEPAGGLDAVARREFLEVSIQLLNREGSTILFSSHYMNDVERIGSRVVLLDQAGILLDRDLDSLRENTSVALIPRTTGLDASTIEQLPGCLHVRRLSDEWHALIKGTPEDVQPQLEAILNLEGIRCARIPLEEFFIEMVGPEKEGRSLDR